MPRTLLAKNADLIVTMDGARREIRDGGLYVEGNRIAAVGPTASLPTHEVSKAELAAGIGVLGAFVSAGLVASNGEARRQIKAGGLRVNDAAVTDEKLVLTSGHLTPEGVIKLSIGKKKHVLLRPA